MSRDSIQNRLRVWMKIIDMNTPEEYTEQRLISYVHNLINKMNYGGIMFFLNTSRYP